MIRTFIALEMNESLQRHLEGVIHQVALILPSVRWVDPHGIHLTLAFLGELTDAQLVEASYAAETTASQVKPFAYRLSRIGTFGSPRHPRVIWMGIDEPSGTMQRLHYILNQELERRGFAIDTRSFSPHLTLARVKAPLSFEEQQQLQSILDGRQHDLVSSKGYTVHHVNVMKSELSRSGARYTPLQEYALGSQG